MEKLILGKEQYYNMDCYETGLNNNVLVVGASGAGKTRGIVVPNLLEATGSYVVSDPKGNLYNRYGDYLRMRGYEVKKLDFINPKSSSRYNLFEYINDSQDIIKMAHMLVNGAPTGGKNVTHMDPFWDEAAKLLMASLIAYLKETEIPMEEQTLSSLIKMLDMSILGCSDEKAAYYKTKMDLLMEDAEEYWPDAMCHRYYRRFQASAV
ncbi:MAG: type IV secretory system conjugative DNA transfer family protein, partial [Pseudobutyrivibrio sp.]|nr:type IV secretory system conjugative DNA transfer family protein [Pseudobutyrivibrio sp.]